MMSLMLQCLLMAVNYQRSVASLCLSQHLLDQDLQEGVLGAVHSFCQCLLYVGPLLWMSTFVSSLSL